MNYKAVIVLDDCGPVEQVCKVILVPENAAESVAQFVREKIEEEGLGEGPPIALYVEVTDTIVCKSVKDVQNKVTSLVDNKN